MDTRVIGYINAMQEFVDNFPFTLLSFFKGQKYDNVLDFILDVIYAVLHATGKNTDDLIGDILSKIFKSDDLKNINPDILYEKLNNDDLTVNSEWLDDIEDTIKIAIIESFLTILGCAAIPEIKNIHMDKISYCSKGESILAVEKSKNRTKLSKKVKDINYSKFIYGYISIPLTAIDPYGKLNTSPISTTGSCLYDLGTGFSYKATVAYSYWKASYSINGEDETVEYFLDESQANALVNTKRDEFNSLAQKNKTFTGSVVGVQFKGDTEDGIKNYQDALLASGYINPNDETNSEEKVKVYNLLLENGKEELLKKSYYKNYVEVIPPFYAPDLYKTKDLDAFIWYAMRSGNYSNQYDRNKMVWDNRRDLPSRTGNEWNSWLSSKKNDDDFIYQQDDDSDSKAFEKDKDGYIPKAAWKYNPKRYPIMQLFNDPVIANGKRLGVAISAQRYYRGSEAKTKELSEVIGILRLNHTMYKFNYDYMRSMRIFSPKTILASMINELLSGSLFSALDLQVGYNASIYELQLSNIVKKAIETNDYTSNDCYFTFSNDEYDNLLYKGELNRYNAKSSNNPGTQAVQFDAESVLDSINEMNSSATPSGTISNITKTVYEVSGEPLSGELINGDASVSIASSANIIYNLIMAITRPILKSLFSPKVMLIFMLNFSVAGLVDLNDADSIDKIRELIIKSLLNILQSIANLIVSKIVEFLFDLFLQYIAPLINKFLNSAVLEYIEKWIKILQEAMKCLPQFDWSKYKFQAAIDDVNYADIYQKEQTEPESTSSC